MLQAIREKAQGWIAWLIVALISVPFALWGIQEYLGIGGEPKVVKVNDREITERQLDNAFQQFRMQLREQLGANYRAGLLDDQLLKRQVLSSLIQQELLTQTAMRHRMSAGKEMVQREIASMPVYQKAGRFDYATYQDALERQGMSPEMLAQRVKSGLVVDQIGQVIQDSAFTTRLELEQSQRLREQKREFGYLLFPRDQFAVKGAVDEAAVKTYYETHAEAFKSPERVKLEYVELSLEGLAKAVKASDEELQGYLDRHADEFHLAEERRVSHILIKAQEGKEEEARQQAEALLEKVKAGENFAELAKTASQDPGSAPQGGDLGFFGRGIMDKAFEEAAYSLKPGEVSGVVRSSFGFHILKLEGVRGTDKADLASVRDRVQAAYGREHARQQFDDLLERLSNLAYEMPDSLDPVVEQLGLKLQKSDWITRQGGEGALKSPKVVAAAFSHDVMEQGNNSEAIELGPDHVVVLRVVSHEVASTKPLAEVKAEVEAAVREQQAAKAAADAGAKALEQLRAGKTLAEVAKASGVKSELPGLVDRFDPKLTPSLRNALFGLPRPAEGQVSYGSTELANGDYAVLALTKVVDGELSADAGDLRAGLDRGRGSRYFSLYLGALEKGADIKYLNQKATGVE